MFKSHVHSTTQASLTDTVIEAKLRKRLTFGQISESTGLNVALVRAAMLGQHPLSAEAAVLLAMKLGLDDDVIHLLQTIPRS
jgi:cyanate lyase